MTESNDTSRPDRRPPQALTWTPLTRMLGVGPSAAGMLAWPYLQRYRPTTEPSSVRPEGRP